VLFDESFAFPDNRERWLYNRDHAGGEAVDACRVAYFRIRENGDGFDSSTGKKKDSGAVALLRIEGAARSAAGANAEDSCRTR